MSELTATTKLLSPEQRIALAQKLRENRAPDSSGIKSLIRRDSGPGPLSFSQQRLWFLDQLHPGNSAYNVYRAVRINGALDKQALERSVQEIVRRHEILRTTIGVERGIPFQFISPSATVPLRQLDLRDIAASKRDG